MSQDKYIMPGVRALDFPHYSLGLSIGLKLSSRGLTKLLKGCILITVLRCNRLNNEQKLFKTKEIGP